MTTATQTHNGWKNRDTWLAHLWLCGNDNYTYTQATHAAFLADDVDMIAALWALLDRVCTDHYDFDAVHCGAIEIYCHPTSPRGEGRHPLPYFYTYTRATRLIL